MYIYTHTYVYIYIHMNIHADIEVIECTHTHHFAVADIQTCDVHTRIHVTPFLLCVSVSPLTHAYSAATEIHTGTHVYMHACMHVYTHTS